MQVEISAQEDGLLKKYFPELSSSLKPDGSVKVTKKNLNLFKEQYKKLETAYKDIEKMENGVWKDNLKVFKSDDLKDKQKENKLNEIKNSIVKLRIDIKYQLRDKSKYGVDSLECLETLSIFNSLMKNNELKNAYKPWKTLYIYFPISNKIIYSKGDDLLKNKIKIAFKNAKKAGKEKDNAKTKAYLAEKEKWVDSLLMLYDQRIKYFGDDKKFGKGKILAEKGKTIFRYRKEAQPDSAYKFFKESVLILKEKSSPSTLQYFFFISDIMYNAKKNDAIKVVEDYNITDEILSDIIKKTKKLISKKPNSEKNKGRQKNIEICTTVLNNITQKFAEGDYSKCEVLIPAFNSKFEENKANADWLKKITDILIEKKCKESELYEKAATALYEITPSADAAYKIAKLYLGRKRYPDAANYYEKAFTQETDKELKAKYYYEAALVASVRNQVSKSYSLAVKATNTKKNYGNPHVLIAQLYVKSKDSCGKNFFEKSWVYWVAVDKLIYSKSIDSSVNKKANELISSYKVGFPSKGAGFKHGVLPGNTVTVNCWFKATTKARFVRD